MALGRLGAMAGYGLKAYLVCQSLNHITRAYGRDNVILDNVHVVKLRRRRRGDLGGREGHGEDHARSSGDGLSLTSSRPMIV